MEHKMVSQGYSYKVELKWRNIILLTYLHLAAFYSVFLPAKKLSIAISWITGLLTGFGTTVGSHRLFSHRSFKANTKLKILLVVLQTMAAQEPIIRWVRDHRVHHKFTDTDADPYNSRRGFFFAHMGWLCCKKHPEVLRQGRKIDMSDICNDRILLFQQKYFTILALLANFIIPVMIGCYLGETFSTAWNGNIYRYLIGLHIVWMVNSYAHFFGKKPYDKNISPTDSYVVGFCALGEGWHNYHHIFPWDYKTAELGNYTFNLSTAFINYFAWLGWATDLKTVPDHIIKAKVLRSGDGSHKYSHEMDSKVILEVNNNEVLELNGRLWGWGDKEMTLAEVKNVRFLK